MDSAETEAVNVESPRELERMVDRIHRDLASEEWDIRMRALSSLKSIVTGNAVDLPNFIPLIQDKLTNSLIAMINDPRSQIVREVTEFLSYFSERTGNAFAPLAERFIPVLLNLTYVTIQVMNESSDLCIKSILRNTRVLSINQFVTSSTSKHVILRRRCVEYCGQLLQERESAELAQWRSELETVVVGAIGDNAAPVRQGGRLAWWAFHSHWPTRAQELLNTLDGRMLSMIQRDKERSWDDYIKEGQPKMSVLRKTVPTPSLASRKKALVTLQSSPTQPTRMPSPQEKVKAVRRAHAPGRLMPKSPAPSQINPAAPTPLRTPAGASRVLSTPLTTGRTTKFITPASTTRKKLVTPRASTVSATPARTQSRVPAATTKVPEPSGNKQEPQESSSFESLFSSITSTSAEERLNSWRVLSGLFAGQEAVHVSVPKIHAVFQKGVSEAVPEVFYRSTSISAHNQIAEQMMKSLSLVIQRLESLLGAHAASEGALSWIDHWQGIFVKLMCLHRPDEQQVRAIVTACINALGRSKLLDVAVSAIDPVLSSLKIKVGGVRWLHAIIAADKLPSESESVTSEMLFQSLQVVATGGPWYRSTAERNNAIEFYKMASTRHERLFLSVFWQVSFDPHTGKSKHMQRLVLKLIDRADLHPIDSTESSLVDTINNTTTPHKRTASPIRQVASPPQTDLTTPIKRGKLIKATFTSPLQVRSPLRTPSRSTSTNLSHSRTPSRGRGKENSETPLKVGKKTLPIFLDITLSEAEESAILILKDARAEWDQDKLLNAVDGSLRLLSSIDENTSTLGLQWLNQALSKDQAIVTAIAGQLLTKFSATKKEVATKIVGAVGTKRLFDQFINQMNNDILERNTLSFLLSLALTIPKDELMQLLGSTALIQLLKKGFGHSNAMTRREVVVAFASLSLYLDAAFDTQLSELNSRELKLVQVYRDKIRSTGASASSVQSVHI